MKKLLIFLLFVALIAGLIYYFACRPGPPAQDEAMAAGLTAEHFAQAADEPDYFRDTDGGIALTPAEIRGRNTWWVWTGGNQAFWDYLANHSFGTFDLVKTISSFPCSPEQAAAARAAEAGSAGAGYAGATPPGGYSEGYDDGSFRGVCADAMYPAQGKPPYRYYDRDSRFCYTGLINEPGFAKPSAPDANGLCLDQRTTSNDPFDEEIYGRPSGIMGLRVFDNPNFDDEAKAAWNATLYYTKPAYYNNPKLVRPYRIGMSCGFCHISHHPLDPPADPENPTFANMSGTIGAQYFWFGRIFGANVTPDNFAWHLLDAQLPGAVDTSFVPADNINNPRAMNSLFDLPARLGAAERFHQETIDGGALDLPEVQKRGDTFGVPHILWDGSDSVGMDAALTRVYINIGEYHQEWIRHIQPIIGGKPQTPITVKAAQENSVFWQATQARAGDMKAYLVRAAYPYRLADVGSSQATAVDEESEKTASGDEGVAPAAAVAAEATAGIAEGAAAGVTTTGPDRGKVVFAENCARCHSSKLPEKLPGMDGGLACAGENYLQCWKDYWEHTETPAFKQAMTQMVLAGDFLTDNYLSSDARVPVHQPLIAWQPAGPVSAEVKARYRAAAGRELSDTLIEYLERGRQRGVATGALESEICSAMATNAIEGHVWDNFASRSYKSLPAVGTVELYDPIGDRVFEFETPGGGRGYQRVPTLMGIWSTSPFLHNHEIGIFTGDPSVEGRLAGFDDGIRELLWPERREHSVSRTQGVTHLKASTEVLPAFARPVVRLLGLVEDGNVVVGPFPDGTPVNLLANLNVDRSDPRFSLWGLLGTVRSLAKDLKTIKKENLSDEEAAALLRENVPDLIERSNCPDFIADRGHYFGTDLSDADKEALIEYVKTF